jgi:hypothetical protein
MHTLTITTYGINGEFRADVSIGGRRLTTTASSPVTSGADNRPENVTVTDYTYLNVC